MNVHLFSNSLKDVGPSASEVTHQESQFVFALRGGCMVYFNEQVLIYCLKHLQSPVIKSLCASENVTIPCCGKELAVSILRSN